MPQVISRDDFLELDQPVDLKKAVVVTGFRRTGKTYLLFEAMQKLLAFHTKKEVVYINFEDERIPQKTAFLSSLVPEIQAFFGQKPLYLFLDELQNMPLWSKWLRRILDTERIKIFVSGSSSKMSSFEIPTELRGRSWEKKVYPLNFREFLRFKNEEIDWQKLQYSADGRAKFDFLFEEYLLYGGLPEVVLLPLEKKRELLQNYFQTVIRKEIIERFKIKNQEALKTLLQLLLNSTYVTVSKLYHSLKSLGLAVGKTTLNNYLNYIQSSYFLQELYFYSPSMRNRLQYPRKIYFIDNGFITALSTQFSKNYGRLWENLVFQQLAKDNEEIFYYRDQQGCETDFVVMKSGRPQRLYQVCYDLTDFETREREIKGLFRAARKLNCQDLSLIVRTGQENLIETKKVKIITPQEFLGQ